MDIPEPIQHQTDAMLDGQRTSQWGARPSVDNPHVDVGTFDAVAELLTAPATSPCRACGGTGRSNYGRGPSLRRCLNCQGRGTVTRRTVLDIPGHPTHQNEQNAHNSHPPSAA